MLKQLACAAASSSSGVVLAEAPSVRAFQLRLASRNVPLPALVLPLPDIRSPSHCAVAVLFIVRTSCRGARSVTKRARWQPEALTERRFRSTVSHRERDAPHRQPAQPVALDGGRILRRRAAREARGLRGSHPRDPFPQRQPRRRIRLERQSVSWMFSCVRLLL